MVFNATFNNISVISWQSVLLVKETGEDFAIHVYRITAVMKVETDIIVSKAASLMEGVVTLVIHSNVMSFKTDVTKFNATFNNISVISWQSVLLVKETGENHRPSTSH
jgi:hypothetical protein